MNLNSGLMEYRKQNGYCLFLVKFEESISMHSLNFMGIGDIRWQVPGISIVGLEVKEEIKEKSIKKIMKLNGFLEIKEVQKLHDYSFRDIMGVKEDREECDDEEENGLSTLVNLGLPINLRSFGRNTKTA